ncbi:MAG: hypothetical protein ACXVRK_00040 [Gaiellaceae bacterium]
MFSTPSSLASVMPFSAHGRYAYSWYENAEDGDAAEDSDASGAGLTSHL